MQQAIASEIRNLELKLTRLELHRVAADRCLQLGLCDFTNSKIAEHRCVVEMINMMQMDLKAQIESLVRISGTSGN